MSTQISIDDIAWEYQLDLPVAKPVSAPIIVGNDKLCVTTPTGQACIAANTYTVVTDPAFYNTAKAFVNAKAQAALVYAENNQSLRNMVPMTFPSNDGTFPPKNAKWSTIQVAGMVGNITKVTATLFGYTSHDPCPVENTNFILQSPLGFAPNGVRAGVQIMYLVGNPLSWPTGSYDVTNLTIGISDQASTTMCIAPTCSTPIVSGIYKPSSGNPNFGAIYQPPSPSPLVPVIPFSVTMSSFNGVSPNGTWTLWGEAMTNAGGQFSITGWGLDITTV
jgi:hypothetical protein